MPLTRINTQDIATGAITSEDLALGVAMSGPTGATGSPGSDGINPTWFTSPSSTNPNGYISANNPGDMCLASDGSIWTASASGYENWSNDSINIIGPTGANGTTDPTAISFTPNSTLNGNVGP